MSTLKANVEQQHKLIMGEADYYYHHTQYKLGDYYALYNVGGVWKESASVTNQELMENAVKITKTKGIK